MARRVVDIALFLLATPVAIWLLVSFVLPFACGLAQRADAFVDHLHRVQEFERAQATWLTPEVRLADDVLCECAWTYQRADNIVRRLVPGRHDAFFASGDAASASSNGVLRALSRHADTWLADRFHPVQTAWWTIVLTRSWYALQLLVLAVPAGFVAYAWGEYHARLRSRAGVQPMGHRFLLWMQVVKHAIACVPLLIALPVQVLTVPCLIVLYAIIIAALGHARLQFIEI